MTTAAAIVAAVVTTAVTTAPATAVTRVVTAATVNVTVPPESMKASMSLAYRQESCWWVYSLNYAPRWYHKHADGPTFDTVLVCIVVLADIVVNIISPENMPPAAVDSETAIKLAAMRVSDESHSFIFDEIYRRLFIEYDLNQINDVVEVEEVVNEVEAVSSDESSNGVYFSDSDDDDDDA